MKLSTIATPNVISVGPTDSLDKAITLMEEHGFHHLPVVENEKVVGMLSDRDLLLAVGWKLEAQRRVSGDKTALAGPREVGEVMSKPVVCLSPDDEVATALRVMVASKIGAFPLTHGSAPVGIVTKIGLLRIFYGADGAGGAPGAPVAEHMRASVHTVGPRDPLHAATRIMHDKHVRHMPVIQEGRLIGIVSDRDIRRACGCEMIEDRQSGYHDQSYIAPTIVENVMTRQVRTAQPTTSLSEAARNMLDHKISALPVCAEEQLVGIITDTDLLRAASQKAT